LITESSAEKFFIAFHSVVQVNNYTSYALVGDVATEISPSMLFLEEIKLSNPFLLEDSTYEIKIRELGVNMTTKDSIKDIIIVFPSTDYHFIALMRIGCSLYKIERGNSTYVDQQCFTLNNRIHMMTSESFLETDGIKIKITNIPNPYNDDDCLHHAWQVSISERKQDGTPIASASTIMDTYIPVIDFVPGTKQKIMFWDEKNKKEITSKNIEILIGVF